ncbi:hypothetical protein DAPPUDRAFT_257496 [Daphnia pulex]|uniref:Uncharacterized protein n=1 Tax=Daphnia pulex TaxID=6669 RepID=E9HDP3_DAPPU|nr:hypothetical protein DAPPUDRAFT_257496 [Daphnia pulex]|eukprot:EFX70137.1 hypothetical protein DAPPUDRAFT_257496 [Daphnia pulex]
MESMAALHALRTKRSSDGYSKPNTKPAAKRRHQENICETDDKNDEAWMKKTPLTEANIKKMLDNFI